MNEMLEVTEETESAKLKHWKKTIFISIPIIVIAILVLALFHGDDFKVRKLKKIFPEMNIDKIICSEPLTNSEIPNSVEYVLFHVNTDEGGVYYCSCPVDFKNEINYGSTIANPFYSLCAYIWTQSDEETNKKLFYEMKKSVDEGGVDYFNDMKNSSNFLRKISGVDGIIPTDEARNIMTASLGLLYGDDTVNELSQKEDYKILFEYKNAYPKVITYKTTEKKYNWSRYPEESLSLMDRQTISSLTAVLGPAYTSETRWRLSVIDEETMHLEDFDKYCSSLESVKSTYEAYETGDAEDDKYVGEWKDGVRSGQGTMNYADGDKYEGEWANNKRNGQGTYYYTDGDRYEGEWKDGKRNGYGTYYYDNGDKYEGEWVNNKKNGQGIMNSADGYKYEGGWKDGKMNGQGTFYNTDGGKFVGEFKDGEPNGQGTLYYADGTTESGHWDGSVKK